MTRMFWTKASVFAVSAQIAAFGLAACATPSYPIKAGYTAPPPIRRTVCGQRPAGPAPPSPRPGRAHSVRPPPPRLPRRPRPPLPRAPPPRWRPALAAGSAARPRLHAQPAATGSAAELHAAQPASRDPAASARPGAAQLRSTGPPHGPRRPRRLPTLRHLAVAPPIRYRPAPARYIADGKVVAATGMFRDYEVQKHDHVDAIARDLQTTRQVLVEANHLKAPYALQPGQHLKVPIAKAYEVASGDTITDVAKRFSVSPSEAGRPERPAGARPPEGRATSWPCPPTTTIAAPPSYRR